MRLQKKRNLSGNDNGLTLIELVIAMAVMSIGLLAIGSIQIWAVNNNKTGNLKTQALKLARAKIEELSEQDASNMTIGTAFQDAGTIDGTGQSGGAFTRSWVISSLSTTSRIVTVTVSWRSNISGNRSVVITSYVRGTGA